MPEQILAGKYVVQNEIARGGMGVIYKALDRTLNRIVAIKMVHAHLSGDSSFVQRFLREARAMARLQHDNIVTIYAVEEDRGNPLLVMEYFQGRNLRELTKNRPRLPLRDIVRITEQLANALAFAHARGIIHRDIKPANVMVDARGKAKLTDFGIAAALDEASITSAGQVIGTPEYMSPEQACGTKLDGRSDLYSVGILLYEMLTGTTPYVEDSKTSILGKLAFDKKELALAFPPDVPSLLQGVVRDLLRRQPEERIPDADTLATQLHEILYTLPQTPPTTPLEESELTMVLASPPPQADDRTRAISPGWETVPTPLGSTEHRERSASGEAFPSREAHPAPQKPPRGGDETTVLPERSQVPPEYRRPERTFPPTPPPASRPSLGLLPWIAGGVLFVLVLGGVIFYLIFQQSEPIVKPVEQPQQDLARQSKARDVPSEAELERQRKALEEETKQLEEKQQQAEVQQAKEEAERRELERVRERAKLKQIEDERKRLAAAEEKNRREIKEQRRADPLRREDERKHDGEQQQRQAEEDRKLREKEEAAKVAQRQEEERRIQEQRSTQEERKRVAADDDKKRAQALTGILDQLKASIIRRDLDSLEQMTNMSDSRRRMLLLIFDNYVTIDGTILDVRLGEEQATAVFKINKLIQQNGNVVTPTPVLRTSSIVIPCAGEGWGKPTW